MDPSDPLAEWCREAVADALRRYPAEADRLSAFVLLLQSRGGPLHDRRTLPGHVTASGLVVDQRSRKVLLIHHNVLDRWLPPGGHLEAGELPPLAARREVLEEVGMIVPIILSPDPTRAMPIDIDSHGIPANKRRGEGAHTHHDFRFAFEADPNDPLVIDAAEVSAAVWAAFDDERVPANLRTALRKLSAAEGLWSVR